MKDILKYLLPTLVLFSLCLIILNRCTKEKIPTGYILVSQSSIDSINAIAQSKPKILVKHDTLWYDSKIKWFPYKVSLKDSTRKDTLTDSDIQLYMSDSIDWENSTIDGKIGYKILAPKQIIDSIFITKAIPTIIQMPCVERKWFLTGGVGLNAFIVSGEFGYHKNNKNYSVEAEFIAGKPFFKLKTGITF